MNIPLLHYRGLRGELEILPEGTVEREAAEKGERIYRVGDLDELLAELAAFKSKDERPPDDVDTPEGHSEPVIGEAPASPEVSASPEVDTVGVEEVSSAVIARALLAAGEYDPKTSPWPDGY